MFSFHLLLFIHWFFQIFRLFFSALVFVFKLVKMYITCLYSNLLIHLIYWFWVVMAWRFFVVVVLLLYPNYFYSNKFLFVYKVIKKNSLNEKRDERHLASFGSTIHIYQIHPSITVIIQCFFLEFSSPSTSNASLSIFRSLFLVPLLIFFSCYSLLWCWLVVVSFLFTIK